MIDNLAPFTVYTIQVSCSTGAGKGPRTPSININTDIGSKLMKIFYVRTIICINSGNYKVDIYITQYPYYTVNSNTHKPLHYGNNCACTCKEVHITHREYLCTVE